jgi:trk system potassium uptake protein TrkH
MLTVICALAYWLAGMDVFEALAHAMTTLATGGYSTSDASMGHFSQPAVHWVGTMFMIVGGAPFVLYVRLYGGDPGALWQNPQVRAFIGFLMATILILSLWLWWQGQTPWIDALRLVAFNVVSIVTTTGYATTDYTLWGGFAIAAFFFLTFVGGCSGSTSGGIKIFRFQIAALLLRNQLYKLIHPFSIQPAQYNNRPVTGEILQSLIAFSFFFTVTVALLAAALGLTGLDFITSFSGAATAVANVGPGLGDIIGPAGNFATLPDLAKWLLCLGMLLGRLEIMTVLVLLIPAFWRS